MHRRRYLSTAFATVAAVVLTACGGGGGDAGTPGVGNAGAALTASNYTVAAQEALSSALQLTDTSSFVIGADARTVSEWRLTQQGLALGRTAWERAAARPKVVAGAVTTETLACENGDGSMTVRLDDANGNGNPDTGESFDVTANNCRIAGGTANGRLSAVVRRAQGDINGPVYVFVLGLTLDNFAVVDAAGSFSGSGTIEVALEGTGPGAGSATFSASNFTSTARYGTTVSTRTLVSLTLRESYRGSGSAAVTTVTVEGTLLSSALDGKAITLVTLTPLTRLGTAPYSSSGVLRIDGANGSNVRITAQSATTVLVELDADGNGSYETSTTRPWSSFG